MYKLPLFSLISFLLIILFINPQYTNNSDEKKNSDNFFDKELVKTLLSLEEEKKDYFSDDYRGTDYKNTTEKFYNILRKELEIIINNSNITAECRDTLNETLLQKGVNDEYHYVSNYHLIKLLQDSSKHKNDLGTYDQCLFRRYKRTETDDREYHNSTYVVFILDKSNLTDPDTNQITYYKNDSYFDDVFYIRAFCLPQAIQKIDTNRFYKKCSDEDYKQFIITINEDLGDSLGMRKVSELRAFSLDNFVSYDTNEKFIMFLKSIPVILCFIQVFIIIFRELIIHIITKFYEKRQYSKLKDINEDIKSINKNNKNYDDDDNDNDNDNDNEDDNSNKSLKKNKKIKLPNWVKVYNKCFNFSLNFQELFNFSLNSTDINNDSGLTYIRGLRASSLFLLIVGLTFQVFMNSISKIFSRTLFYEFLKNIFYSLFFIGLRYSPRIILSCSGYTLTYKFLCYINKNFSFYYVIKFILYQIHKYIILISFFLFERYTLYDFNLFFFKKKTPTWKYFDLYILSRPEGANYILSFFTLSSVFSIDVGTTRYDQTLIDYFWLPYNEISFFIIGVAIISIGYKFKLRIDYFILILILILPISKIVYSYLKKTSEGEIYYATLYYFLFDYGKFMINPLFNLPYYLMGMYFGLINYSVQKGIISLYISELFKKKISSKNITKEEEMDLKNISKRTEEEDEDEEDIDDNNINFNTDKRSNKSEEKNYRIEIQQMPFLIAGVKISNWLRKNKARLLSLIMALIILIFISIHFIALYLTIGKIYDDQISNNKDEEEISDKMQRVVDLNEELLKLTNYIANKYINVIYRIDIEIVVFLSQSLLFIFYFKGQNFINDFFCHVFWAMLNKSYFSYILFANPMILFIFYQSETKILLNLYNLILYSLISSSLIFLTASFSYIFFELPYKKLIHYIGSNDDNKDIENDEAEEEKEENSDDDDDEDD